MCVGIVVSLLALDLEKERTVVFLYIHLYERTGSICYSHDKKEPGRPCLKVSGMEVHVSGQTLM